MISVTRILIVEKNPVRMRMLGGLFLELLDTNIERVVETKEFIVITTLTHEIKILYIEDVNSQANMLRGLKYDFTINNTMNQNAEDWLNYSVTVASKFNERLKK